MFLKEWALAQGIHPSTAYKWFADGVLPVPATRVGPRTILVFPPKDAVVGGYGLYARVSAHDQKADLVRQSARLMAWANDAQVRVVRSEAEVGSGMNGARRKLRRMLEDPAVGTIVVEHRDRFGRMNVDLVESALKASGRRLIIIDSREVDDDLIRDMTEVLTSMCARLYGRRSAKNRAQNAMLAAAVDAAQDTQTAADGAALTVATGAVVVGGR